MTAVIPAAGRRAAPDRLFEAYVFDLDGTVYLGDELLPGSVRLIEALRALGRRTLFVSNNPTRDPRMYAEKLSRLGIPTSLHDIVNPVVTTTRWLQAHHPDAVVFVIGEEPLRGAIAAAGIRQSDRADEIDVVVASYDRTFDYRKLQIAFDVLHRDPRARLIATNLDAYCPLPGGRGEPDAAAVVAAIEASSGARCAANMGKPGTTMLATVSELLGLDLRECVMVGDRLSTDVRMALDAGMPSALVLTGETTRQMLDEAAPSERPDHVVERIDELLPEEVRARLGW
jgi:phosphoglycolate/pyridoxal phosphate phosphatase family enzyme